MNTRLEEECTKDFEKILEERNVITGLNDWDNILDQARQRKDRSVDGDTGQGQEMHLMGADELHSAFMQSYLHKAAGELEGKLKMAQDGNQSMMSQIQAQREEIERLVASLEGMVKDIDGAVKILESQDGETASSDLRKDVWDIEKELAATK